MSLVAMPTIHSFAKSNSNFDNTAATVISGTVTNSGVPVNHANVNVKCNAYTLTNTTDSNGNYSASFTSGQCGLNSTVSVVATSGSLSGSNSITVQNNTCSSNVTVINVNVPEFGIIAGISAAVICISAALVVRSRSQGENKV